MNRTLKVASLLPSDAITTCPTRPKTLRKLGSNRLYMTTALFCRSFSCPRYGIERWSCVDERKKLLGSHYSSLFQDYINSCPREVWVLLRSEYPQWNLRPYPNPVALFEVPKDKWNSFRTQLVNRWGVKNYLRLAFGCRYRVYAEVYTELLRRGLENSKHFRIQFDSAPLLLTYIDFDIQALDPRQRPKARDWMVSGGGHWKPPSRKKAFKVLIHHMAYMDSVMHVLSILAKEYGLKMDCLKSGSGGRIWSVPEDWADDDPRYEQLLKSLALATSSEMTNEEGGQIWTSSLAGKSSQRAETKVSTCDLLTRVSASTGMDQPGP